MNGEMCQHKDCERTDATPIEFTLYRHGELVDELHALETTPTLPPAEWLEGAHPDVHHRAPAALLCEPAGFLFGEQVRAGAYEHRDVGHVRIPIPRYPILDAGNVAVGPSNPTLREATGAGLPAPRREG